MSRSELISTLKRGLVSTSMVLMTLGMIPAAYAATLAAVSFPEQTTLAGKTVVLNGLGVRNATMLKVRVYVIGLYLSGGNQRIAMYFVHDVSADKLRGGWTEGFEDNTADVASVKDEIAKFNASMRDVKSGASIVLDVSGDGVDALVNDTRIDSIAGKAFQQALLAIWLGPRPPNEELRQAILGR